MQKFLTTKSMPTRRRMVYHSFRAGFGNTTRVIKTYVEKKNQGIKPEFLTQDDILVD